MVFVVSGGCERRTAPNESRFYSEKIFRVLRDSVQFELTELNVNDGKLIGAVRVNNPTRYNLKDLSIQMQLYSDTNYWKSIQSLDDFASYMLHTHMLKSWESKEVRFNVTLPQFKVVAGPDFTPAAFEL